jgi:Ion transport protein
LKDNSFYRYAFKITIGMAFKVIMITIVCADICVQGSDSYPIKLDYLLTMEYLNVMFLFLYSCEIAVRMTGLGFRCFFKGSKFNLLDVFIVGYGAFDLAISCSLLWPNPENLINSTAITVLRAFRLVRIFKLARYWMRFELLLETMGSTVIDMGAFSIMLCLFIFIYTILGLEFFAKKAKINSYD